MDLFHGDAASAIVTYQSRVSSALFFPPGDGLASKCDELGVPRYVLEALLCNALARYELLPRRIEIMRQARANDRRALDYLAWIDDVLAGTGRTAGQTGPVFAIEDPTGEPGEVQEAREALGVVTGRFEGAPARERKLKRRLGLPGERLRPPKEAAGLEPARRRMEAEQKTAEHRAVGFFSAEMAARFRERGHGPNDELISDLLCVVGAYVDKDEVRSCRYAYLQDVG